MICFVVLAHYVEDVLQNQVENIRKYVPGSKIILYNGGLDPAFGQNTDIEICPYSRLVQKPNLARPLYDTMCWLVEQDECCEYEFLVYLDSDMMFINPGYEAFLKETMSGYDCMGLYMRRIDAQTPDLWWGPGRHMWAEWDRWQPFFNTDYFIGCLNTIQVYRKQTVNEIIGSIDAVHLEQLLAQMEVFALQEILH